jgi:tellurium resistance protein TerZ
MNLVKGQSTTLVDLSKNTTLPVFKIGAAWIKGGQKKLFGLFNTPKSSCDLDLCAFAVVNGHIDSELDCSFQRDRSGFMKSSGDDRSGGGNKDKDNEIIAIDMNKVPNKVEGIIIIINSYSGEKFDQIDYAHVRVYEGRDNVPEKIHCKYAMSSDETFQGGRTLIIGSITKENNVWKFNAIGDMRTYQYIADFKSEMARGLSF